MNKSKVSPAPFPKYFYPQIGIFGSETRPIACDIFISGKHYQTFLSVEEIERYRKHGWEVFVNYKLDLEHTEDFITILADGSWTFQWPWPSSSTNSIMSPFYNNDDSYTENDKKRFAGIFHVFEANFFLEDEYQERQ